MNNSIDLLEVAEFCKNEVEQKCKQSDRKHGYHILYVSIMEDTTVKVSQTPHILRNAEHCILVHSWDQLAATIYYDTYLVQFIKSDGTVHESMIDDEYSLDIHASSYNCPARLYLRRRGDEIYSKPLYYNVSLDSLIPFVWKIYLKCKAESRSLSESKLIGEIAKKNEVIASLEEEINSDVDKDQDPFDMETYPVVLLFKDNTLIFNSETYKDDTNSSFALCITKAFSLTYDDDKATE